LRSSGLGSATAGTVAARAAEPADTGAVTDLPTLDMRTDRFDSADDLVAGHARKGDAGKLTLDRERIAVADAAGTNTDQQFLRAGYRHIPLDALQFRAAPGCDHRNRLRHGVAPGWQFENLLVVQSHRPVESWLQSNLSAENRHRVMNF